VEAGEPGKAQPLLFSRLLEKSRDTGVRGGIEERRGEVRRT